MNELLLNLLVRDDPHEQLFDFYQHTLQALAQAANPAATLRSFEKRLLQELGYALQLEQEADNHAEIIPGLPYRYVPERGAVREPLNGNASTGVPVLGKTLRDLAADDFRDAVSAQQSKQLMRMLLNHHLAGKMLHTRELIMDFQKI